MTNNFVFRIFGAPTTFDLYQGSGNEMSYFQNFDNGSKENVKFTIHRMVSGKVSYSYLRYNFISSGGRPNSFFGMSVIFDKEYCKDVKSFYTLFDKVYTDIILKNGILLTELKDHSTAQAKYLVRTFADADTEMKLVEKNITDNLKKYFANDILPLDNSFVESNSTKKLNEKMGNAPFLKALRECSWVHISSAYSKREDSEPSEEFLATLDDTVENTQKAIPAISINMLKGGNFQPDINRLTRKTDASIESILDWLQKEYKLKQGDDFDVYLQKQPKLQEHYDKLLSVKKQLDELANVVPIPVLQAVSPVPNPNPQQQLSTSNSDPKSRYAWFRSKKYPTIIAYVVVLLVIIIIVAKILIPGGKSVDTNTLDGTESSTPVGENNTEESLVRKGDNALEINDFDTAIDEYERANRSDLVDKAKSEAIYYLCQKAADEKIPPQKSIEILEKTKKYGYDPAKDIAEFQRKIDHKDNNKKKDSKKQTTNTDDKVSSIKIKLEPKQRMYSKKETFTATATNCENKSIKWKFKEGLFIKEQDKTANPTTVEVKSCPDSGEAQLSCYIDNKRIASIIIKISP
jgi:hypothetical protein